MFVEYPGSESNSLLIRGSLAYGTSVGILGNEIWHSTGITGVVEPRNPWIGSRQTIIEM